MGDTERSPTISTENQGIAAKVAGDSGHGLADPSGDGPALFVGESSLVRIRMLAEGEPELVFTSVADRIDLYLLKKSFRLFVRVSQPESTRSRPRSTPRILMKTSINYINDCAEDSTLPRR
jgi:hypothetical protein